MKEYIPDTELLFIIIVFEYLNKITLNMQLDEATYQITTYFFGNISG